ncbi:MAG: hypothetical protein IJ093_03005 [Bacilli bacterium]|nr:hypothetical protein [Bacilli bacterium]
MNKVKIVVSINPSNYCNEMILKIIDSGIDVICFDMSSCNYEFCKKVISQIRSYKQGKEIGIMLDLEGPCVKLASFKGGKAKFKTGDMIRLYNNKTIGDNYHFSTNYSNLVSEVKMHDVIKLSDGNIILEVVGKGLDYIILKVVLGGEVLEFSKVILPNLKLDRKYLTAQDHDDIVFADKIGASFVALSNMNSIYYLIEINDLLIELGNNDMAILPKIQDELIFLEIDKIINYSDGIILNRDDLVLNVPVEKILEIKNLVISKCIEKGKLCIVNFDKFSKFVFFDVANFVLDRVDGLMFPFVSNLQVEQIKKAISVTEKGIDYSKYLNFVNKKSNLIFDTICYIVVQSAFKLSARAIVAITDNGLAAKFISSLRPSCGVLAVCFNNKVAKGLRLNFGVVAISIRSDQFDDVCEKAISFLKKNFVLEKKDKIVITGGYGEVNHINFVRIEEI